MNTHSWLSLTAPGLRPFSSKPTFRMKSPRNALAEDYGSEERGRSSEKRFSSCWYIYVTVYRGGVRLGQWRDGTGEEGERRASCGLVSAVVAVVVGPAWRGGGIGLVVIFPERCGIVGGRVDVCLLERRWVEVRSFIW